METEVAALALAIERIDRITQTMLALQSEIDHLTQTYVTYRDVARASTLESIQTISRYRSALDAITRLPVEECVDGEPCARCGEAHDIARAALEYSS